MLLHFVDFIKLKHIQSNAGGKKPIKFTKNIMFTSRHVNCNGNNYYSFCLCDIIQLGQFFRTLASFFH